MQSDTLGICKHPASGSWNAQWGRRASRCSDEAGTLDRFLLLPSQPGLTSSPLLLLTTVDHHCLLPVTAVTATHLFYHFFFSAITTF